MVNIFQKIFGDNAGSVFGQSKEQTAMGIDIGSSAIKVVQLRKKGGKAILETYGALAFGPYAHGEVGQTVTLGVAETSNAILDVIKEANITTKIGAIAIPSASSLIFIISLPGMISEAQLSNIIPNEARKYIPVPIAEVALDWWMIPRQVESTEEDSNNSKISEFKTEVLVIAIHNDTITKYKDILNKTAISSKFFEMEIFSSIRSSFGHELNPVLLIDLGASKTKLSIVEFGIIKSYHVVNKGGQDMTNSIRQSLNVSFREAEKLKRETGLLKEVNKVVAGINQLAVDYIVGETKNVVLAYEKKYNKSVSKIILVGGGSLLKGFLDEINSRFEADVLYGKPFDKVEFPAFLDPVLEVSGPEFSVALGLALRQLS